MEFLMGAGCVIAVAIIIAIGFKIVKTWLGSTWQ